MEGTKEGAKLAIDYFEKCRDIFRQPGVSVSVRNTMGALVENQLARAKAKWEGGSAANSEESLGKQQKSYKECIELIGQESTGTVGVGVILADSLKNATVG